ncbi:MULTISPECIES: Zn-dependent hydrolase [unclassified Agrobacterium]|uniref:Zn-dependent hydrolase n=1 Tax=unclassified Agrobacterium TaxID=2632611 RepID=UPI00244A5BE7|nr:MULTISPECIES: Zn-dependent hydrolase [unclassified Agrobacterium]MDH0616666.1 Zn-dependent hydrolase [Agrobacterium sp. GD03872]MDH0699299.1 Zn-dependent hydrolase [Agrobacterium sp. GD03871]MDH1062049.1 Zn-dependent hydrolase [Agrobacterium sp. GD03992]MDH2213571.1 Zn-dependent hydrolase [Agrobacterium sp. GD03643]MDH2220154.1 Zn-dependent hydrolase [Agrobacterium sp. GD03638]
MRRNLDASIKDIEADIDALAQITDPERPWTRRAFSPRFDEGRDYLRRRFLSEGLNVSTDAGGNLIGRREGTEPQAGTIMLGSHSDTVPDGGRFDGVAGVVVALEVARILSRRDVALRHNLAVVDFLAEEVSIFGVSCIGSRAMAGVLPRDWLRRISDGRDLATAICDVGGKPETLEAPLADDLKAFLELHIEQGPVLEREKIALGVVTTIVGINRVEIEVKGRPDHAGTTPMGLRADALVAAARIVNEIERYATELSGGPGHFTATVGEFEISPNAANVVPGRVRMLVDIRAERAEDKEAFVSWLTGLDADGENTIEARLISGNPGVQMDDGLQKMLAKAADGLDTPYRKMVSGAGHDAAFMARLCPSAMLFVPCRDGRSHCPEEWADAADLALAAEVLANTIMELDRKREG